MKNSSFDHYESAREVAALTRNQMMYAFPVSAPGTKRVHLGTVIKGEDGKDRLSQICNMGQRTSVLLAEGEVVTCTTCLDARHVARTEGA